MEQAETIQEVAGSRSNMTLWIMLLLFLSPIILAWVTYAAKDKISLSQKQHGDFVVPIVPLPLKQILTSEGQYFNAADSEASWLLVSLYSDNCDKTCQFQLETLHDLNRTLHKNQEHLKTGGLNLKTLPSHIANHSQAQNAWLWLIDPEHRLMMSYGPDIPWKGVLADIKHLIKYSKN